MSYLNVLDEGAPVQDHCVQMDFVGAGVAATRPSSNDRVTVTIPGAADVAGWTDDGAVVRLTTVGDRVAIGAAVSSGTEKVRVVNAAGVAIRSEGRVDLPNTGVAAGAATQAASHVGRFTASMWTGAAAVDRDFDIFAVPSSLVLDEAGGAFALLAIDWEGARCVEVFPDGLILPLTAVPAAGVDSNIVRFRSQTSGGLRNIDLSNEGDAGTDSYYLFVKDNGAGNLMILGNNAGAPSLGFLGAGPVPRQTAATPTVAELKAGLVALGLFNP